MLERSALEEHVRSRYGQADKGRPGRLRLPYDEVLSRGRVKVRRWMKSQSLNEFAGACAAELGSAPSNCARISSLLPLDEGRGGHSGSCCSTGVVVSKRGTSERPLHRIRSGICIYNAGRDGIEGSRYGTGISACL